MAVTKIKIMIYVSDVQFYVIFLAISFGYRITEFDCIDYVGSESNSTPETILIPWSGDGMPSDVIHFLLQKKS